MSCDMSECDCKKCRPTPSRISRESEAAGWRVLGRVDDARATRTGKVYTPKSVSIGVSADGLCVQHMTSKPGGWTAFDAEVTIPLDVLTEVLRRAGLTVTATPPRQGP